MKHVKILNKVFEYYNDDKDYYHSYNGLLIPKYLKWLNVDDKIINNWCIKGINDDCDALHLYLKKSNGIEYTADVRLKNNKDIVNFALKNKRKRIIEDILNH